MCVPSYNVTYIFQTSTIFMSHKFIISRKRYLIDKKKKKNKEYHKIYQLIS